MDRKLSILNNNEQYLNQIFNLDLNFLYTRKITASEPIRVFFGLIGF